MITVSMNKEEMIEKFVKQYNELMEMSYPKVKLEYDNDTIRITVLKGVSSNESTVNCKGYNLDFIKVKTVNAMSELLSNVRW